TCPMRNIPPGWDSLSSSLPWRIDRSYRRACKSCRDCPGRNPRKSRRRFWLSDGQKKSTAQPGMTMRRNQVPKEGGSLSSGISCLASKSAAIEAPPARVFVPVDTRDSTSQPLAVTIVLVPQAYRPRRQAAYTENSSSRRYLLEARFPKNEWSRCLVNALTGN